MKFLAALLLLIIALAVTKVLQIQQGMAAMAANQPPPASVEVTPAQRVSWQPRVAAVGSLNARAGIDVSNEVEGVVETIHVESGQSVKKGDLIVSLNDDVEQADLASFIALQDLARTTFKRSESMWKKKTISETDFDNARSELKVAQAQVAQTKARIAKKAIRAPFDGNLGIRHVSVGQYIKQGTMLFSLQDYSVLYTDFAVAEKYLPEITPGLDVRFRVSAYPKKTFIGQVQAVDSKVDENTRNISVRSQLTNDDNLLRPGMYADIDVMLDQQAERIVVPVTSIVFSSFGNALFIVDKNEDGLQVAKRITVKTGEQRGDQVAILFGLEGGEQVVQAGVSKLRNNVPVAINEQQRLKAAQDEIY